MAVFYIKAHPARTALLATALFGLIISWTAFLYRTLWLKTLHEANRLPDFENALKEAREKISQFEKSQKPTDPISQYSMRRIITYLVNASEATHEDIIKEVGVHDGQANADIRSLWLDYGFLNRSTVAGKHTYKLTKLAEDYVSKFNIPTVNRDTIKNADQDY
ncbi:MAG: hypothetical protein IPK32_18150 [Verrucomicrobiaceae bacterium]|nr:hypothetical protein [Verrucomicrobiaceae bacterium]